MTAEHLISLVRSVASQRERVQHDESVPAGVPDALKHAVSVFSRNSTRPQRWARNGAQRERSAAPRYQRCLLNAPRDPFQIVLSAWAPHSFSPIHDHDRIAGVVAALWGTPLEQKYISRQRDGHRVELAAGPLVALSPGAVSDILDDAGGQVHQIVNRSAEWAFTLHVYLRRLERYRLFTPSSDGLYSFVEQSLWFDATDYWKTWDSPSAPIDEVHIATC